METSFSWGWYFLAMLAVMALSMGLTQFLASDRGKGEREEDDDV
ncbi:hypothetical protein PPGU19_092180 (plasmid) [Paraburkholderia sp. PGU19]|nr:hypothetical protein PPGU19_092180 [Paraburkholderia sp. PGU19]